MHHLERITEEEGDDVEPAYGQHRIQKRPSAIRPVTQEDAQDDGDKTNRGEQSYEGEDGTRTVMRLLALFP